ncbi:MAG: ATP-binding protein [Candidatus Bathyarchaeia archaeon]
MNRLKWFDDLDGLFEARLKDVKTVVRSTRLREGEIALSSQLATIEAKFFYRVFDKLHNPCFIAIERETSEGLTYLIYEIVGLKAIHFQMPSIDSSVPKVIRLELLDKVREGWEKSEEAWIDMYAVPTGYKLDVKNDELKFMKSPLSPLTGAYVHLLSDDAVKLFLCYDEGVGVGSLLGFDIDLKINAVNLVRYHMGVFGFTGVGKSNLTAFLIRKAMESIDDLKVIIFDIAGEYSIHILDILQNGWFYVSERSLLNLDRLIQSQIIPETLEGKIDNRFIEIIYEKLMNEGRLKLLSVSESYELTLNDVLNSLRSTFESGRSGAVAAKRAYSDLTKLLIIDKGLTEESPLREIRANKETYEIFLDILKRLTLSLSDRAGLKSDLESILEFAEYGLTASHEKPMTTPEELAFEIWTGNVPKLTIVYVPEPIQARTTVSRFIDKLLLLKKTSGLGARVLTVLDEAQEYIPDRVRSEDKTENSNRAVEMLLRQGRKYRAHCWLATQRVAHLNVNALQQLHSYFVSTLPRFYDRMVIADAFSLSYDVLEKTTTLDVGEWLFVSYKATKRRNVPVFIRTPNNEEILLRNFGLL